MYQNDARRYAEKPVDERCLRIRDPVCRFSPFEFETFICVHLMARCVEVHTLVLIESSSVPENPRKCLEGIEETIYKKKPLGAPGSHHQCFGDGTLEGRRAGRAWAGTASLEDREEAP